MAQSRRENSDENGYGHENTWSFMKGIVLNKLMSGGN